MSMFNDIIWRNKDNETECIANSTLVSLFAKRFPAGRWSFLGLGSEIKWYSTNKERPGGKWDRVAELMMIKFRDSGHPVFRATSPLFRGTLKSKGRGKLSLHFCADGETIETFSRTIISVNQVSIYEAISDLCEEYSSCQTRTGRLVVSEQSEPFFAPDWNSCTRQSIAKLQGTSGKLPQPDQLIKICTDAGFLKTVEVGQYFMTKHTDEFLQFAEPVTCREYTLPRNEKSSDKKGWIQGNTKIGPVLEVTTSYLHGKHWVEIRIESVNKDNSHSWVRISHDLNKLVTDLIDKEYDDNEQGTSTTKTEVFAFASRSKAKAEPRRPSTTCSSSRTVPIRERIWTDIEPGAQSNQAYPVANRLNTLFSAWTITSRRRWCDWILETERWSSEQIWALSILVWWCMEEQDGRRRRQQEKISILYWPVRTRNSLPPNSPRSFRTQSHWSHTSRQCVNSGRFLRVHLPYRMCNQFTLHHKFRIDSGKSKFEQGQTDSILYSLWIPCIRITKIR